ncbi:hypothetical protein SAMN04488107_1625 [Geodermatophilus saharensis]|uniref:Uncharacterized protein n=1 Tax=Geodermatophilus saharensis TaxID=1137994 RepID=A0A239C4M0_9ACTN|nr:hypothetical protein SAMN04488107_1625 [Geodermatophilus saharensis]
MASVVTRASTVSCGHVLPPKLGKVELTSTAKLKVGDNPVVLGISGATVGDCGTVADPNTSTKPCTTATAAAGFATKLKVGNQPVLLETLSGTTDGTVSGTPQTALAWKAPLTKLQAS